MPPKVPKYIHAYCDTLCQIETQGALTEGAVRIAFQDGLTEAAKRHHFTVLAEQHIVRSVKQVVTISLETVRIVRALPELEVDA